MADDHAPRAVPRSVSIALSAAGILLILGNGLCAGGAIMGGPSMTGIPDDGIALLMFGMVSLVLATVVTLVAFLMALVKGVAGARPTLLVVGSLALDGLALLVLSQVESLYVIVAVWVFAIILAVTALGALRKDTAARAA